MGVEVRRNRDHATPRKSQTPTSIEISNMRNERYRIIVETASQGIWTIDEKNLTTLANHALAEMLGYEQQEMLGKSMFDFMDPAVVEEAQRSLRLRREGVNGQLEYRLLS